MIIELLADSTRSHLWQLIMPYYRYSIRCVDYLKIYKRKKIIYFFTIGTIIQLLVDVSSDFLMCNVTKI